MEIPAKTADAEEKVEWCISEIQELDRKITGMTPPPPKPWYKQAGVWFTLLLVGVMGYIIYLFYLSEKGYTIWLPF